MKSPFNVLLNEVQKYGLDDVIAHLAAVASLEGYSDASESLEKVALEANQESYTIKE